MRKRYYLIFMLIVLTALGFVCMEQTKRRSVILETGGEEPYINVNMEYSINRVSIWQDEEDGKAYFFLPSCVGHHMVRLADPGDNSVRIDGEMFEAGDIFKWEEDREYELQITDSAYEVSTYAVTFMKSANIPAAFIYT